MGFYFCLFTFLPTCPQPTQPALPWPVSTWTLGFHCGPDFIMAVWGFCPVVTLRTSTPSKGQYMARFSFWLEVGSPAALFQTCILLKAWSPGNGKPWFLSVRLSTPLPDCKQWTSCQSPVAICVFAYWVYPAGAKLPADFRQRAQQIRGFWQFFFCFCWPRRHFLECDFHPLSVMALCS